MTWWLNNSKLIFGGLRVLSWKWQESTLLDLIRRQHVNRILHGSSDLPKAIPWLGLRCYFSYMLLWCTLHLVSEDTAGLGSWQGQYHCTGNIATVVCSPASVPIGPYFLLGSNSEPWWMCPVAELRSCANTLAARKANVSHFFSGKWPPTSHLGLTRWRKF